MDIVGIGNALWDVSAWVDEDFAPRCGFHPGASNHVEPGRAEALVDRLEGTSASAGGGAANTMRIAAALGASTRFVGSVGDDARGRRYRQDLAAAGVEALLSRGSGPTGLFCALVQPESLRTVIVSAGAAGELQAGDIPDSVFAPGGTLYLEGFLAFRRDFLEGLAERGARSGMRVALDIGSYSLALRARDFFLVLLERYIDIAFMNEDEFRALTGAEPAEALARLAGEGLEIVVKRAERGALWAGSGSVIESAVRAVEVVDETGAGDAFAAGFLVGRAAGLPPERALRAGNAVAGEAVRVLGSAVEGERARRAFASVC